MAGLNSKEAPFLIYLTVFKSRLGAATIPLDHTGFGYTPDATLERHVKRIVTGRSDVSSTDQNLRHVFEYLRQKRLITNKATTTGRYAGWTLSSDNGGIVLHFRGEQRDTCPVYHTDIWLADPAVPSTIGVPTEENVGEIIELTHQLRLLTRTKNSWTAGAQTIVALRSRAAQQAAIQNPFHLLLERVALLRQIIAQDGLMLTELLRELASRGEWISRDEIADRLDVCASRAYKRAQDLRHSPPSLAEAKRFVDLTRATKLKFEGKKGGPGVLEHRTSPRLEWLTDVGALRKAVDARNAFEYQRTPNAKLLLALLDRAGGDAFGPEDVAIQYLTRAEVPSGFWGQDQPHLDRKDAIREAYRLLARSVGPSPIKDVCFVSLALSPGENTNMGLVADALIAWAADEKAITLSGGRYTRLPEFVHMTPSFVEGRV
jgi:hypothetical protein